MLNKRLTWKRSLDGYTDCGLRKGVTAYEAICKLADYEEAEAEVAAGVLNEQSKPITNADRIRHMSDEELADWLARTQIDNVAEALKIACVPWEQHPDLQELTAKDCLGWLKQPAEVR